MPPFPTPNVVVGLAEDVVCSIADAAAGLSAASDWRAYEQFLDPFDSLADQRGFAFGYPDAKPNPIPPQSCCTKFLLAVAREANKDGQMPWEGYDVDVLRVPQRGIPGHSPRLVGDSPELARRLALHHGLFWEPTENDPPRLFRGVALLIGGDDGLPPDQQIYGGYAHGVLVVGENDDGTFATVEGGKGPGGTAIAKDTRELFKAGRTWWLRRKGEKAARMVRWTTPLAAWPELPSGD